MILKIFTQEFYSIGALFAVFGAFILGASMLRRRSGNKQFFRDGEGEAGKRFRTSGNVGCFFFDLLGRGRGEGEGFGFWFWGL